uniref:Uncharacterized protein n=1 Tax=Lactuca sativa TaxID=4236 RepID=A0A9R1WBQ6_LACSA|nr:hypothetical protein LSAT_V11C200082820 [Lactuca sativa]
MTSSSSKSAKRDVSDDHHQDLMETTMVAQEETSEMRGVIVNVQIPSLIKRRWRPLEDAKLIVHVVAHGRRMWRDISKQLPGRSTHACRVRWANYLSPGSKDSPFSKKEEMDLVVADARCEYELTGRASDSVKSHFRYLMAKKRRRVKLVPSAATSAIFPLTNNNVVYPARSSVLSRTTASSSGKDVSMNSTFTYATGILNYYGQRTFVAECAICRRVFENGGLMVNGKTYMASAGNVQQTLSVNVNLNLATEVYGPQPPSPPLPPPQHSASSTPTPTFIDFLGVGSV